MNTTTTEQVDPRTLVEGDRMNAGGTRGDVVVHSVSEWGTGTVSVNVLNHDQFSQVWFKRDRFGNLPTATKFL